MALLLVPEDAVSPGILGFTLVFAIGLALYFLIRSMNKHIGRIKAPREADLKQAEWERRQEESKRSATGDDKGDDKGGADGGDASGSTPS